MAIGYASQHLGRDHANDLLGAHGLLYAAFPVQHSSSRCTSWDKRRPSTQEELTGPCRWFANGCHSHESFRILPYLLLPKTSPRDLHRGGIPLTEVAPICRVPGHGSIPPDAAGVRGVFCHGFGVSGSRPLKPNTAIYRHYLSQGDTPLTENRRDKLSAIGASRCGSVGFGAECRFLHHPTRKKNTNPSSGGMSN